MARQARADNDWDEFIQMYGTHYVVLGTFGARVTQQLEFSYEGYAVLEALEKEVENGALYRFAKSYGDKTYQTDGNKNDSKYVEEFVLN